VALIQAVPTSIPGVLVFKPQVFGDERGFLRVSWNARDFRDAVGGDVPFVQDNHTRSRRGVLRGLHTDPAAAGKTRSRRDRTGVRCRRRRVQVVADVRPLGRRRTER
jgi:dTDP-4-dehydrorhamnose 3,5-epimerase-like enzyme